ncbi:MAG: hypothetical protein V1663_03515 [archaeon]
MEYNYLLKRVKDKKLLLFGEIHGTKEIPLIIQKIITLLKDDINLIFLEIPKDQQKYINDYVKSINENDLFKMPFFKNSNKDGRDSKENLYLIKCLLDFNLKIICVDPNEIKDRDYLMYREIKENLNLDNKKINIFITGNFHASKEKIVINKKEFIPCGYYLRGWLKNDLIIVNFVINNGNIYNLRLKKIINKDKKEEGIFPSQSKNYDFEYIINKVSPCSFL